MPFSFFFFSSFFIFHLVRPSDQQILSRSEASVSIEMTNDKMTFETATLLWEKDPGISTSRIVYCLATCHQVQSHTYAHTLPPEVDPYVYCDVVAPADLVSMGDTAPPLPSLRGMRS